MVRKKHAGKKIAPKRRSKSRYTPLKVIAFGIAVLAIFGSGYYMYGSLNASNDQSSPADPSDPIRLAYFSKPPSDGTTAQYIAQSVDALILTRKDEAFVQQVFDAGYTRPISQYLRGEAIEGPRGLTSPASQTNVCTTAQSSFKPYNNHVANEIGEFCQIHDSIATGSSFDHDLNPATPHIAAAEDWFLHNSSGERLGSVYDPNTSEYYSMNPGSQQYREYYFARVMREMAGNPTHTKTGMNGIFLDNIELSWNRKFDCTSSGLNPCATGGIIWAMPGVTSYTTSEAYAQAVRGFVEYVSAGLRASNPPYPIMVNMVNSPNIGLDWNPLAGSVDGAMQEGFMIRSDGPVSASRFEQHLEQMESWIALGKDYLAVTNQRLYAKGSADDIRAMQFSLAAFLLATDGVHGRFRHASSAVYSQFWKYPEYDFIMGAPAGPRVKDSTSPLVYTRQFACGSVRVDVTNYEGTIQVTTPCPTGATPTSDPTASPLPTSTPGPTSTPTTAPTTTATPPPTPTAAQDNTSPTVGITSPTDGSTIKRGTRVTVTAQASDNVSVTKVEFYLDNALKYTDSSAPYEYPWKPSGKTPKAYRLTAKAYDAAGNSSVSTPVTVTVIN